LLQLEYNGQKVIRQVFKSEEIYKGKYSSLGPDLIVLSEPGFDLKDPSVKRKSSAAAIYRVCTPG